MCFVFMKMNVHARNRPTGFSMHSCRCCTHLYAGSYWGKKVVRLRFITFMSLAKHWKYKWKLQINDSEYYYFTKWASPSQCTLFVVRSLYTLLFLCPIVKNSFPSKKLMVHRVNRFDVDSIDALSMIKACHLSLLNWEQVHVPM